MDKTWKYIFIMTVWIICIYKKKNKSQYIIEFNFFYVHDETRNAWLKNIVLINRIQRNQI